MKKDTQDLKEKKPVLKSTLTFFNSQLTYLNTQRLQLNRSKGFAKYLAQSHKNLRTLTPLDTTLGVMSFTLYMARFSVNFSLLAQILVGEQHDESDDKTIKDLYYNLLNDSLWGAVNLTQFFWLSFNNSQSAGFYGIQLEVIAQLIDVLVMVTRFQESREEYELKLRQASGADQQRLTMEWRHRELNFIRSFLTASSIMVALGLLAFSIASVPVSPIISAILLISALSRVLIDAEKDKQLMNQLRLDGVDPQLIAKEQKMLTRNRLNDLNQVILYNVFIPVGLFLFLTTPISLLLASVLLMSFIHCFTSYLINTSDEQGTAAYSLGSCTLR
ncbi:hypothetical protein [Legionella bononiensis]|uniref:Uncharacterized protein n=1 Tax=Legionella bononiensis TaxID=2793102 RepID=A0ABS1W787_9GAMM|nr:hypothetical protein [Legionella bononiensis]MBL7481300.1 hypothetical protein [Legionella bononiensis]MBL7525204.1 hypothetical protein [Legionella bononiensis]MBL7561387.1 hypothetical protein [Legionella bononiensis]